MILFLINYHTFFKSSKLFQTKRPLFSVFEGGKWNFFLSFYFFWSEPKWPMLIPTWKFFFISLTNFTSIYYEEKLMAFFICSIYIWGIEFLVYCGWEFKELFSKLWRKIFFHIFGLMKSFKAYWAWNRWFWKSIEAS